MAVLGKAKARGPLQTSVRFYQQKVFIIANSSTAQEIYLCIQSTKHVYHTNIFFESD